MFDSSALHRRETPCQWVWLALGLMVLAAVLVLFAFPGSSSDDEIGPAGPTVRPQSDTRPMPPPSVARTRPLAA